MSDQSTPPASSMPETAAASTTLDRSVLTLLRELQAGTVKASSLSAQDRQGVVEHLGADGYNIPEIAEILKTSERTIARDRKAIKAANAIRRDPKMIEQVVGQLIKEAELCVARIRRAARERGANPAVKVDAEHRAWQIISDLTVRLQSLGYLPTAAQQIKADLTHRTELPPAEELQKELDRISAIAAAQPVGDPALTAQLSLARDAVLKLSVTERVHDLSVKIESSASTNTPISGETI